MHLAGWPGVAEPRPRACSPRSPRCGGSSSSAARRARASGLKLRQPLRRMIVAGAALAEAHADEIADELRVKEVVLRRGRARPSCASSRTCAVLGPRLGAGARRDVRARARRGPLHASSTAAASRSTGTCSSPTRCSSSGSARRAGRSPTDGAITVALDTRSTTSSASRRALQRPDPLDPDRCARSRASRSPTASGSGSPTRSCSPFADRIAEETLAVSVELDPSFGSRRPDRPCEERPQLRGPARAEPSG